MSAAAPLLAAVDYAPYILEALPVLPCIVLAAGVEWFLYRRDYTMLVLWRPTVVAVLLLVASILWYGWTQSVDMASVLRMNGEEAIRLEWTVGLFAGFVALVSVLGLLIAFRRIFLDFSNARMPLWLFAVRVLPLVAVGAAAVRFFVHGDSLVGDRGFLALVRANGVF